MDTRWFLRFGAWVKRYFPDSPGKKRFDLQKHTNQSGERSGLRSGLVCWLAGEPAGLNLGLGGLGFRDRFRMFGSPKKQPQRAEGSQPSQPLTWSIQDNTNNNNSSNGLIILIKIVLIVSRI